MKVIASTLAIATLAGSASATTITKSPDQGNYWWSVGPSGSYVYADSFIAPTNEQVLALGTWLDDLDTGGSTLRFEVWGDSGGPNAFDIIASTGSVNPMTGVGLGYNEFAASSAPLTAGAKYWFIVTGVGEAGPGYWQTGGHTQNSIYNDNGTFWYSNDPSGVNFDGQNLTPEMAFSVTLGIPSPGAAAILGLGGIAAARRRRA